MAQIIQPIRNLPNGTRINGVEHIYQTTKPTTRVDGSALVARDKWYKTDDGTEWFWNGTYWLSPPIWNKNDSGFATLTSTIRNLRPILLNTSTGAQPTWFLHRYNVIFAATHSNPSTDYNIFRYFLDTVGTGSSLETGDDNVIATTQGQAASNTQIVLTGSPSLAINSTNSNQRLGFQIRNVGAGQNGSYWSISVQLSHIYV